MDPMFVYILLFLLWKSTSTKQTQPNIMSFKLLPTFITAVLCFYTVNITAQLQEGFYRGSCGLAEIIVKQEVRTGFIKDNGVAAGLVRLHFHDCFVRVRNSVICFSLFMHTYIINPSLKD